MNEPVISYKKVQYHPSHFVPERLVWPAVLFRTANTKKPPFNGELPMYHRDQGHLVTYFIANITDVGCKDSGHT